MIFDSYVITQSALNEIYLHTLYNEKEVRSSVTCTCLHCKATFASEEASFKEGAAVCPRCFVSSVVGSNSGVEMTSSLLDALHEFWFERQVLPPDFDYHWFDPVSE